MTVQAEWNGFAWRVEVRAPYHVHRRNPLGLGGAQR